MKAENKFIGLLMILLFITSCSKTISFEELQGNWKSEKAWRNGRATETLDKVFFDFNSQDTLVTNLFGRVETFPMNYKYPQINLQSSKLQEINVISLERDTLSLSLRIRQYKYDFDLVKK